MLVILLLTGAGAIAADVPLTRGPAPKDWKNAELWCAPAGTNAPVGFTSVIQIGETPKSWAKVSRGVAEKSSSAPAVFAEPTWPATVGYTMPIWYPSRAECQGAPALVLAEIKTTAAGFSQKRASILAQF